MTMEIGEIETKCYKCQSIVRARAEINSKGKVRKYIEIFGGARRELPWESTLKTYCNSCLPEIDAVIAEESPKCEVCGSPVTPDLTSYSNKDRHVHFLIVSYLNDERKEYYFCSSACRESFEKKLNDTELAIKKEEDDFSSKNAPPAYSPVFTEKTSYSDKALLQWVRSLPQPHFNHFMGQLMKAIEGASWVVKRDKNGEFSWARKFETPNIYLVGVKGLPEWIVGLPLPICVWKWLEDGAEPISFPAQNVQSLSGYRKGRGHRA